MNLVLKSACLLSLMAGSVTAGSLEMSRCASDPAIDRLWREQGVESSEIILRKRAVAVQHSSHHSWIRAIPEPAIQAILAGIGLEAFGAWRMRRRKH